MKLDNKLDLFGATPPLESLRVICSVCASNHFGKNPYRMMALDVRRAYFYAKAVRPVYIEIPAEDLGEGDQDNVARLNLSFYGIRDAAQNWTDTSAENFSQWCTAMISPSPAQKLT